MSAGTPRPFAFDRLVPMGRAEAAFAGALHRTAPLWRAAVSQLGTMLGGSVRTHLGELSVVAADVAARDAGAGFFRALMDGAPATIGFVSVDVALAQGLAAAVLGGAVGSAVEPRPLLPVEEACLEVLASQMLARSGARWRLRSARPDEMGHLSGPMLGQVAIGIEVGALSGWLLFWADADRLEWARRPPALGAPRLGRLAGLRREVRVRIGELGGSRREMAALECGDVLLPGAWIGQERPIGGTLRYGSVPVADVHLDWSHGLRCTLGAWSTEETGMAETKSRPPTTSTAKTLEPVRPHHGEGRELLELVVGGRTLTLAEVLALAPGAVLALDERSDAPVDLVLDGRTIGRGELVEVEGRLGVRILSIGTRG